MEIQTANYIRVDMLTQQNVAVCLTIFVKLGLKGLTNFNDVVLLSSFFYGFRPVWLFIENPVIWFKVKIKFYAALDGNESSDFH